MSSFSSSSDSFWYKYSHFSQAGHSTSARVDVSSPHFLSSLLESDPPSADSAPFICLLFFSFSCYSSPLNCYSLLSSFFWLTLLYFDHCNSNRWSWFTWWFERKTMMMMLILDKRKDQEERKRNKSKELESREWIMRIDYRWSDRLIAREMMRDDELISCGPSSAAHLLLISCCCHILLDIRRHHHHMMSLIPVY